MRMVANDVAEKQRELQELGRVKDRSDDSGDDQEVTQKFYSNVQCILFSDFFLNTSFVYS